MNMVSDKVMFEWVWLEGQSVLSLSVKEVLLECQLMDITN